MELAEDFLRFLAPGADRLVSLAGMLAKRSLPYSILPAAGARHVLARLGEGKPGLVLCAHYDRVEGSPGYLDNSAACLALADFGARFRAASRVASRAAVLAGAGGAGGMAVAGGTGGAAGAGGMAGLWLLFTDGEENPAEGGALSQGSFSLARGLVAALAQGTVGAPGTAPAFLVFDVMGRGDRLLLSTAPSGLLSRGGRGGETLAARILGLGRLVEAAAALGGLSPPLRLPLPWSDDLGLVLGGLPALAVSLLPSAEAEGYAAFAATRRPGEASPSRAEAGEAWPPTWNLLHSPGDGPSLAEEAPFRLAAALLDALPAAARSLGPA